MALEINTTVSVGEKYGKHPANLILQDAKFYGRPNFSGELDNFGDSRRKFTVLLPNELADQLRNEGWNVKTDIPTAEQLEQFPDRQTLSHMKVFLNFKIPEDKRGRPDEMDFEKGPDVHIIQGENQEKLNSKTVPLLDRSRFENIDMEIRAWEYNPEDHPGKYSARLVQFVGVLKPNLIGQKYGIL
jgi:hypothetical protein